MAYIDDLVVYNGQLSDYKNGLLSPQDIQAKYIVIKTAYDAEMVKYNKAIQDLNAFLNTDGHINRPIGQPLVFTSEPNATRTYSGQFQYMTPTKGASIKNTGTIASVTANDLNKGPSDFLWVDPGRTISVTYENLSRSFMDSTKIAKIVYSITHLGSRSCMFHFYQDPAKTLWLTSFPGDGKFSFRPIFYDKEGNVIPLTSALFALNSLNSAGTGGIQEYVSHLSGIEPLLINGSSVKYVNNMLIAPTRNDWKAQGSRWDATEWDVFGSPYEWYGAGVGLVNMLNPNLTVGVIKGGDIWFSFNGRVSSKGTPTKPTAPEAPAGVTLKPWAIRKSGSFKTLNRASGFFKRRINGSFVDKSNQNLYDVNKLNLGSHRIRKSAGWTGQNKIGAN